MSISAQAAIDVGKEILEKPIPDVIVQILKEAFQIVCIFLLNKGIAGLGWGTLEFSVPENFGFIEILELRLSYSISTPSLLWRY